MTVKRVRARTGKSAKKKCTGKKTVVGKVDYIKGSKKKGMKTYSVRTHKRKKK